MQNCKASAWLWVVVTVVVIGKLCDHSDVIIIDTFVVALLFTVIFLIAGLLVVCLYRNILWVSVVSQNALSILLWFLNLTLKVWWDLCYISLCDLWYHSLHHQFRSTSCTNDLHHFIFALFCRRKPRSRESEKLPLISRAHSDSTRKPEKGLQYEGLWTNGSSNFLFIFLSLVMMSLCFILLSALFSFRSVKKFVLKS